MTHLNDQALLAHWHRHRNAEAFRELASRHARMVYGTALRVLRNSEDAEDVSQECLLALAHTRRPPRRNVAAWLHRTVYRAALNYARSRKRRGARERAYAETLPESTGVGWDEIRELVDEAVAGLPESCREPLVRHFFEAQTHESIAASLGVSRQTVTHRINQGVTMVRRRLSEKGVVAPAGAALATLIQSHSAVAEPAGLAVEIGRIAIASTPSVWATVASYAGGAGMKVAAAAVLAVVIGGAAWRAGAPGSDVAPASVARAAAIAEAAPVTGAETPSRDAVAPRLTRAAVAEVAPDSEPGIFAASQDDHASLSGVVVLPDGRPFAGSHVWIVHPSGFDVRRGPSRAQLCVADDAGRFSQSGLGPGDYRILVTEPETMAFSARNEVASVSLAPGEQKTGLRLVYGQEGSLTVSGVVVDAAGKPIEGVLLTTEDEVMRSAITDREGRFALRYLPEGEVFVYATHDAYTRGGVNARGGDQDVRIVLEARGAVAGRVIDAKTGSPITRFDAVCRPGYLVNYRESVFRDNSGFNDREGRFRMENIPAGDATIAVRSAGYEPVLHHVTVEAGMVLDDVEIALEEARNRGFSGQVLTADGSPIGGARIYLDALGHVSRRDGKHVTVTDADGVFRVNDPPPTTILVHAWHPAFAPGSGKASDNTVIVLKPSARLDVEVVSGGAPMEGVTVRATCYEALYAGNDTRAQTDANGRAVLDEITPGDITVAVEITRGRSWHEALYLQPGEAKSLRVDIPESACVVEGVVVVDGAIAPEALVCLYVETPLGREILQRSTGPDGTFRFDSVPAGVAQLAAFTAGDFWRAFVDDIPLRAGEVSSVTVDATMPHAVRGAVRGLGPDERVLVLAMHGVLSLEEALAAAPRRLAEPVVASTAMSDDGGAYVLPLHRPGTYTVLATAHRGNDFVHHVGYDLHVVEVTDAGDVAIDLTVQR